MEIVQYSFFINATVAITLISIVAGVVGAYIVSRRMLFITGGITHTSFGGLGLGVYLGLSPTITALVFALASAFGIEALSQRKRVREDSAIAVFWALGMALGVIFIYITPGYNAGLTGFLFGDILTITLKDLIIYTTYTILVLILFTIYRKEILYTAFDREFAKIQGVKVQFIEYVAMIVISLAIILTVKLIGIMLLLSFLSLPQMSAELFTRNYNKIVLLSIFISFIGGLSGLFLSAFVNVPTSATIVFVLVLIYAILWALKKITALQRIKEQCSIKRVS